MQMKWMHFKKLRLPAGCAEQNVAQEPSILVLIKDGVIPGWLFGGLGFGLKFVKMFRADFRAFKFVKMFRACMENFLITFRESNDFIFRDVHLLCSLR